LDPQPSYLGAVCDKTLLVESESGIIFIQRARGHRLWKEKAAEKHESSSRYCGLYTMAAIANEFHHNNAFSPNIGIILIL